MTKKISILLAIFCLYCTDTAMSATWNVPGDSVTIQGAIDLASYGDTIQVEIGLYYENITLKNGVTLAIADPVGATISVSTIGSVVTAINCDPNTVLDGFNISSGDTINGGGIKNNNSDITIINCSISGNIAHTKGGGIYNYYSNPTIENCTILGNNADDYGSGIYNDHSDPIISNCTFNNGNSTSTSTKGGGIYNTFSNPTITNCSFNSNRANSHGGGMYNFYSDPIITGCEFNNNYTFTSSGGAIYNYNSNPTIINSKFIGNIAASGGGIYNTFNSNPLLSSCTFTGNSSFSAFGIENDTGASSTVLNCVIWPDLIGGDAASVSYSNIAGGYSGTGNIDADPLFDVDISLLPGSPCIDAGNNDSVSPGISTDFDGNPRFIDDPFTPDTGYGTGPIVDMGAYEYIPPLIYVDTTAAPGGGGTSWATAYKYLQDALTDTATTGKVTLVAEGTYRPDQNELNPFGTGDRTETFDLVNAVAIYGGYQTGGTGLYDPELYETVLSGDLRQDDGKNFTNNTENSYHVVTSDGCDPDTILDSFTITAGNADGTEEFGGGMYNETSSPTVIRCKFIGNFATLIGGGLFSNGQGPTVINCSFIANSANEQGGGVFNKYTDATFINCMLNGNSAYHGGGMFNDGPEPIIINSTFFANSADTGGGMYNNNSNPTITNCILWRNTANTADNMFNSASTPTISYSDIAGSGGSTSWDTSFGNDDGGNIDTDPIFKDSDGPDDIPGNIDDDLQLANSSPCIDAGDNNAITQQTDLEENQRFTDDPLTGDTGTGSPPIVEMGAYERYELCGTTAFPYPPVDYNFDCKVNLADLAYFAQFWMQDNAPL